jgi:lysophospholipase L1-like esterase
MADFNKLKDTIRGAIYPNGRGAISADKHQAALLDMADTMQETDTKLTELSEEIVEKTPITDMTSARFYDMTGVELGSTYNGKLGSSTVFTCIKCEVKAGEKYRITTYTNTSSAKAYCVVDSNNVVVQLQESAVVDFEVVIVADGILYVNSWATGYPPMQVEKLENKFSKLESQIEDISSDVVELQKSKGKVSLSTFVEVRFVGQYRNASGDISNNAALSISSPIHLVSGASVYFKTRSGIASVSALSLVTSDGTYIKTLHTGNEGEIQYIALEDCYVEVCDYNETFSEKSITILYSELSATLATMATKQSLLDVNAKVANNKSLIRKSTMLEHLCNPFVKTTIHLFGDSITQGQGSSDFSATGDSIPNFTSIRRNVGKKSYAALFAAQVKRLYNRLVWTSVYSDANINKDVGLVTNEGNFQVNNINDVTFIQFKFKGTQFSVITQQYSFGGIFKVYVDNQVKQTIDTYGSGTYLTTEIKGLSDAEHIVEFVATGTKSHSSSINVLRVAAIGLNKQVEIINDGIIGHQSTSTNGVVYQNASENDDFIIWMSGTNDRINGAWETENSILGLMTTIIPQKNPNAELIIMSANPCGNDEFENPVYLSHMDEINASLAKMARKYDLCFISHYNYLTKYCREQQQQISLICSDGVHPNDLGHMLIYQNLCAELNISADSSFL